MCMKVRVTERILQDSCKRLSQTAEQVEQSEIAQSAPSVGEVHIAKHAEHHLCQSQPTPDTSNSLKGVDIPAEPSNCFLVDTQ